MGLITKESIKASTGKGKIEKVDTPDWSQDGKGFVYCRSLSAKVVSDLAGTESDDKFDNGIDLCMVGICDEKGEPICDDGWREFMLAGPFKPLIDCSQTIQRLSGLDKKEADSGN